MKLKALINRGLFYLSVPKCPCCGERLDVSDLALCQTCSEVYLDNKALCFCGKCLKPLSECLCVNDYLDGHFIHKLVKVFHYKGGAHIVGVPQNELLYHAKRGNRRDINRFIADEIAQNLKSLIKLDKDSFVIT